MTDPHKIDRDFFIRAHRFPAYFVIKTILLFPSQSALSMNTRWNHLFSEREKFERIVKEERKAKRDKKVIRRSFNDLKEIFAERLGRFQSLDVQHIAATIAPWRPDLVEVKRLPQNRQMIWLNSPVDKTLLQNIYDTHVAEMIKWFNSSSEASPLNKFKFDDFAAFFSGSSSS